MHMNPSDSPSVRAMNVLARVYYGTRYRVIMLRDYVRAAREYPQGMLCGWCRRPNFFFDDCGWFAITPDAADTPVTREERKLDTRCCCRSCWDGPLGQKHVAYFGLGDR
jgi:hypothetical protein